jgi:hypothetical protein
VEPRQTALAAGPAHHGDTLPVAYPVNGAELAKRLRVNAKSLRSLIRLHNLVPGHLKHKEYRIFQDAETVIWHHVDVQALSRR